MSVVCTFQNYMDGHALHLADKATNFEVIISTNSQLFHIIDVNN